MSVVEKAIDKLRKVSGSPAETIGSLNVIKTPEHAASPQGQVSERRITIDREAVRSAGYLPESGQDRRFADEYRQIKRPLIAAAFAPTAAGEPSPRLVMMASALPGDGKTFTSINLALSIARERDTSIVLVDADVAKPHVSRIFGVGEEPGLLDLLGDPSLDPESFIIQTDVRGLSILPAGNRRDQATEMLGSSRMTEVVGRLLARDPRRVVLFDSSPLLLSSESLAIASAAGQVVLVVRSGKTPRRAVLEALGQLGESRAVSLVLNQGSRGISRGMYGYGDYGSYGEDSSVTG